MAALSAAAALCTPAAPPFVALRSTLWLSLTLRKLIVSMPDRPWWGTMGGLALRSSAHCVVRKKACALMSDAPARDPSRFVSSLMSSFLMMPLHRLRR
jgi:hypothetical protein